MNNNEKPLLELADFLPYKINTLAKRISTNLSTVYEDDFSINLPEWRVIATLGADRKITASEICEYTFMDKVQVSRAIKNLRSKELIHEEIDQNDNRAKYVFLSESGMQLYISIVPKALTWEQELLSVLNDEERESLTAIVTKITNKLDRS